MANPQHIEWLLEGVESWNENRRISHSMPDLSGSDIASLFQEEGKLSNSGRVDLSGINLSGADLSGTRFLFADLKNANLTRANLSNAVVGGADLTGADLTGATVDGANFVGSQYTGARLAGTNFWQAMLVSKQDSATRHLLELKEVTNIESLLSNITAIKSCHPNEVLFYRGHSNLSWSLRPSLLRTSLLAYESQMLTDLIARRPEDFAGTTTALSQWTVAQHHGLKTRFLDITKNPLVALFFACEENQDIDGLMHIFAVPHNSIKSFNSDSICIVANFAKLTKEEQTLILTDRNVPRIWDYDIALQHLYHYIRQEKPYFEERIDVADLFRIFVVEPQLSSERIRAQTGAFLTSALNHDFEHVNILANGLQFPVYAHYTVEVASNKGSNNRKSEILRQLRSLNITRETLYPGVEETAKAIIDTYSQQLKDQESTPTDPG